MSDYRILDSLFEVVIENLVNNELLPEELSIPLQFCVEEKTLVDVLYDTNYSPYVSPKYGKGEYPLPNRLSALLKYTVFASPLYCFMKRNKATSSYWDYWHFHHAIRPDLLIEYVIVANDDSSPASDFLLFDFDRKAVKIYRFIFQIIDSFFEENDLIDPFLWEDDSIGLNSKLFSSYGTKKQLGNWLARFHDIGALLFNAAFNASTEKIKGVTLTPPVTTKNLMQKVIFGGR